MQVAFYMAMDLDQAFGGYGAFDLQAFGDGRPFTIEHDAFPLLTQNIARKPLPAARERKVQCSAATVARLRRRV